MADDLPKRMVDARVRRGVTQAQLADAMRVKQATISMVEGGELVPSSELRDRLRAWVESEAAPRTKAPRGARGSYATKRVTLPK